MRCSVITSTYNREKYIESAIKSFLYQDYKDKEMVIVDDCGNDRTIDIVKKYVRHGVSYLRHNANKGQGAAQRTGIENCTGDYICILDDDDMLYDGTSLSCRAEILNNNSNIDFVYARWVDVDSEGNIRGEQGCEVTIEQEWYRDLINTNTLMWRKQLHERIGNFDMELTSNEDWDWKLRLMLQCEGFYLPKLVHKYRQHNGMRSAEHRQSGELSRNEVKMREKLKSQFEVLK